MKHLFGPLAAGLLSVWSSAAVAAGDSDFFEAKIRPVLVEHCFKCHAADAEKAGKLKGGLRLDTREAIRNGGDAGPAVVPGKPGEGTLLKALRYDGDVQMPPKGKLPDEVVKDFETWIKNGAADPRAAEVEASGGRKPPGDLIPAKAKQFWAFQPPRPHPAPPVKNTDWPKGKVDSFVLARLEAAGLPPAPPADPRTLIRRLAFDLTGLPPTPDETEAFARAAADNPRAALDRAVNRLLASPAYGERWARVWLDVARYAEDQAHVVGSDQSLTYPNAYLYRDWVIKALNDDLPYDQFVRLQLAADLLDGADSPDLAALGFIGLGPKYYQRNAPAVMADEWEDRVDVIGRGLLGLTLACARCHDHKYDPLTQADYYGLAGVFAGTQMFNRPLPGAKEKTEQQKKDKVPLDMMHVVKEGTPTDLSVAVRGDVGVKGPLAPRRFPAVLCAGEPTRFTQGSGRKELADAMAAPRNPLTARVIVNRVWAAYFSRGIVGTPSNFGQLGDRPTHPELLDDLAVRFVESGWSLKWLHREIVRSATYQQSSDPKSEDPDNRLLGRMPRRRLGVEAWRDAVLAVTGTLDVSKVGGPSIDPLDPQERRRTVYSRVSRLELNRLLAMFDFPDPNVTAEKRAETTTPLQKLFVLNNPFMTAAAAGLYDRLAQDVPDPTSDGDRARIDRAYRLLYGRPVTDAEAELGLEFLANSEDKAARWKQYAHVLLAATEMLYVD